MAIWTYRLRRFLAEREVFISLVILGVLMMVADIFTELEHKTAAARTRMVGIAILLLLFIGDFLLRKYQSAFPIPLMLTDESDRRKRRALSASFLTATHLWKQAKVIEAATSVRPDDLIIHFSDPDIRTSKDERLWHAAWTELVDNWEHHLDRPLSTPFASEGRCYHIFPHIVLPLAFALGASVNLRRRIVLYHSQGEQFYKAVDLSRPRSLLEDTDKSVPPPKKEPKSFAGLPKAKKLILHVFISSRHSVQFQSHADYKTAANAALRYDFDLNPDEDWLPYLQHLVSEARSLVNKYEEVVLCLSCPAVIAFGLGMALSRNSKITVCHWLNNEYVPVFSLSNIEKNLPFD